MASISIYAEDYIKECKNPTQETFKISCLPKFSFRYNRNSNPGKKHYLTYILNPYLDYQHLESSLKIIDLQYDVPLFSSYMFGTARRIKWREKVNKSWSIRKDTYNQLLSTVSVNQLK